MYSAILFDLDNTLIDRDVAFQRVVQRDFALNSVAAMSLLKLDQSGYGNQDLLLRHWKEAGGRQSGGRQWSAANFRMAIASELRPNDRLLKSLQALCNLAYVGIITNGGTASQLAKWRASGLDTVISRDRLWISEDVGLAKPDPALFRFVASQLNVLPKSCLYLGDQPELDVGAAERAGMTAWLVKSPLTAEFIDQVVKQFVETNSQHAKLRHVGVADGGQLRASADAVLVRKPRAK